MYLEIGPIKRECSEVIKVGFNPIGLVSLQEEEETAEISLNLSLCPHTQGKGHVGTQQKRTVYQEEWFLQTSTRMAPWSCISTACRGCEKISFYC